MGDSLPASNRHNGARSVLDAKLPEDGREVDLDGSRADAENDADLSVALAFDEPGQNVSFTLRGRALGGPCRWMSLKAAASWRTITVCHARFTWRANRCAALTSSSEKSFPPRMIARALSANVRETAPPPKFSVEGERSSSREFIN